MKEIVGNALNCMMNAIRAGKADCTVPSSKLLIAIVEIMKKRGYIVAYSKEGNEVTVELGNITECRAIKPRFNVTVSEYDKFIRRLLPARDFGILIVSTSKGLMAHEEAMEKNIGGSLIAYCF
ncbi:30S ribosomal protein S8 [Candidatus Pacearchaeota archaeon]|nr:30S ribosomal protein S8 [Candidatus Pacearchaeota archaeon]